MLIPAPGIIGMWSKWEERFKTFGAKRSEFVTSSKGGPKGSNAITGSKCLQFFDCDDSDKKVNYDEFILEDVIDKTLCSEILKVTVQEEDFSYQVKDPMTGDFYGTKTGHPILKNYHRIHLCQKERMSINQQ